MKKQHLRLLLLAGAILVLAPVALSQQPSDNQACIEKAQQTFAALVDDYVRGAVMKEIKNDYRDPKVPLPKAFALCINWEESTPEVVRGSAWGFGTGRTATSQKVADSVALSHCMSGNDPKAKRCTCYIVSRGGGKAEPPFPAGWSGGRCK